MEMFVIKSLKGAMPGFPGATPMVKPVGTVAPTLSAQALSTQARSALARFGRERQQSAWIAARQAELNMWAGRPIHARIQPGRDWLVRRLLSRPVQPLLAGAFTMRWLSRTRLHPARLAEQQPSGGRAHERRALEDAHGLVPLVQAGVLLRLAI